MDAKHKDNAKKKVSKNDKKFATFLLWIHQTAGFSHDLTFKVFSIPSNMQFTAKNINVPYGRKTLFDGQFTNTKIFQKLFLSTLNLRKIF